MAPVNTILICVDLSPSQVVRGTMRKRAAGVETIGFTEREQMPVKWSISCRPL
jgi:hypothetical protein